MCCQKSDIKIFFIILSTFDIKRTDNTHPHFRFLLLAKKAEGRLHTTTTTAAAAGDAAIFVYLGDFARLLLAAARHERSRARHFRLEHLLDQQTVTR